MKFGKSFELALEEEHFPEEWVSASIKYKQLKKCINKVVKELSSLGLNASTLHMLVAGDGSSGGSHIDSENERSSNVQYEFEGNAKHFQPKILLTVDDDLVVSAGLSPNTRQTLEDLLAQQRNVSDLSSGRIEEINEESDDHIISAPRGDAHLEDECKTSGALANVPDEEPIFATDEDLLQQPSTEAPPVGAIPSNPDDVSDQALRRTQRRTIEITLRADSEFFNLLSRELEEIDHLQAKQKELLTTEVDVLGKGVMAVAKPGCSGPSSDLYAWREIFALYRDAAIFFSTTERDHGSRNAEDSRTRIQWFQTQLAKSPELRKLKSKRSMALLEEFLSINQKLLQSLLFQEMNTTATQKILKKFDKRTSLTARSAFPEFMSSDPFFADSLSRAICFVISENLLTIIPDIDDYTCPVCASITYKPVRLECGHVFCIRCLVMLQRQRKSNCPICRANVVLRADSENIDESLLNFLKMYFPRETKAKQSENERAAGMDQLTAVGLGKREGNCVIS